MRTRAQREKALAIAFLPVMWLVFVVVDFIADRSFWGAVRDVSIAIGLIVLIGAIACAVVEWVMRGEVSS